MSLTKQILPIYIKIRNNVFSLRLLFLFWGFIKGTYYTKRYCVGIGKIRFNNGYLRLRIVKGRNAKICLNGDLILSSHCGGRGYITINLGEKAKMEINGDVHWGQNTKIHIHNEALLTIGGRDKESVSGITCDTMIMVYKKVEIGKDLICSWNVFISDSDWHSMYAKNENKIKHHKDVFIGDHVWIGSNVNIGKGSKINDNSIIASYTKITGKEFPADSTIAGTSPKVIRSDLKWSRDI